jgi:hypothetical protein
VEIGEIERALQAIPGVSEAAVAARAGRDGETRLAAYLVYGSPADHQPDEIRRRLGARLPDYMIPASFVRLDALPLSPNGKVDRAALPAPVSGRAGLQQPLVPPRDGLEQWMAREWEDILDIDRVGRLDRFFELGGTSIQAAEFINRLQLALDEFVFVVLLFECPTIADLADRLRRDYAPAVSRMFPGAATPSPAMPAEGVTRQMLARAERLLASTGPTPGRVTRRNPPAVFILAPPRSGTTLLLAMLASHSRLSASAELNLLGYDRMGARRDACSGAASVWLDGTIRAVMDAFGLSADDAIARLAAFESADAPVADVFAALQSAVAPRMLVDKSPGYGLRVATLAQAEATFDGARYIHLSRHPYGMIHSFAVHHMDQVYFNHPEFTPAQAGEIVWTLTHQHVLDFLAGIPGDRHAHLSYEDLVRAPEPGLRRVCGALGIDFEHAMLDPYGSPGRAVTRGVRPQSKPLGDPKFAEFAGVSAGPSDVTGLESRFALGEPAIEVARRLGYEMAVTRPAADEDRARHSRTTLQRNLERRRAIRSREAGA